MYHFSPLDLATDLDRVLYQKRTMRIVHINEQRKTRKDKITFNISSNDNGGESKCFKCKSIYFH
jgi:hypothetical protein